MSSGKILFRIDADDVRCKVVRLCSVPGLLLVLAPGDPVQPGVGEGPQGGEGRVVVAPLQGGARAVANLNMHHQYYRSSQWNTLFTYYVGTLRDHDHIYTNVLL